MANGHWGLRRGRARCPQRRRLERQRCRGSAEVLGSWDLDDRHLWKDTWNSGLLHEFIRNYFIAFLFKSALSCFFDSFLAKILLIFGKKEKFVYFNAFLSAVLGPNTPGLLHEYAKNYFKLVFAIKTVCSKLIFRPAGTFEQKGTVLNLFLFW